MDKILQEVKGKQAHQNTMYHALYDYYVLNYDRAAIAKIFGKTKASIGNWINRYEKYGHLHRTKSKEVVYKKFGQKKREWIVQLYKKQPLMYLDEAGLEFLTTFGMKISASSISIILHEAGMTYKVIERRAKEIQLADVMRFCDEMQKINWTWEQLLFLDEVSLDGDDLIRKRGFGTKGESLIYRGQFRRTARKSLLCFIGVSGLLQTYETEGTFDRLKFADCCKRFATEDKIVYEYPGAHSVWLMDGAKIHCSSEFIHFLRSMAIVPIFLPAYSPFLNPIEFMFGAMKKRLSKYYSENRKIDQSLYIYEVFESFTTYKMDSLFEKCGYLASGTFDISRGFSGNLKEFEDTKTNNTTIDSTQ